MIKEIGFAVPVIILTTGIIFLLRKKKAIPILLGIVGLLLLEITSYLYYDNESKGKHSLWTLYFSGPLYLLLINNLYTKILFTMFKKKIFKLLLIIVLLVMVVGLFFIHAIQPSFVTHYIAGVELIVILYPIMFFLKLIKEEIDYDAKYFVLNAILFLFFSMEIILYVMMKFLIDHNLSREIPIGYFRYFLIQLFYISLIYFGHQLSKAKNE